jgi:DNA-binding NarL/FixJ family response regulator
VSDPGANDTVTTCTVVGTLGAGRDHRQRPPHGPAREREIAGPAARGLSNPDIADALALSVRSVETYVLRVYRKLGVRKRSDLSKALGVLGD